MENWEKRSQIREKYLVEILQKTMLSDQEVDTLIEYGIEEHDLSLNANFIKPCIQSMGVNETSKKLIQRFHKGNILKKIGVLKLFYWVSERIGISSSKKTIQGVKKRNKEEYENRLDALLPELVNCKQPILQFFFQWTFKKEDYPQYFKNCPEDIYELYYSLKETKNLENIRILNKICPTIDFDNIDSF